MVVSKETVVLRRRVSCTQTFGLTLWSFIDGVDIVYIDNRAGILKADFSNAGPSSESPPSWKRIVLS